jgi:hypothetical protein
MNSIHEFIVATRAIMIGGDAPNWRRADSYDHGIQHRHKMRWYHLPRTD